MYSKRNKNIFYQSIYKEMRLLAVFLKQILIGVQLEQNFVT